MSLGTYLTSSITVPQDSAGRASEQTLGAEIKSSQNNLNKTEVPQEKKIGSHL